MTSPAPRGNAGRPTSPGRPVRDPGLGWAAAAALALVAHVLLAVWPLWPALRSGEAPAFGDHWIHYYRAQADERIAAHTGSPTGYDPKILAGVPHGVVDVNSHGSRLVVRALSGPLGTARAYALWAALAVALVPVAVAATALGAGLGRRDACGSVVGAVAFVHLDTLSRSMTWSGMYSWLLASAVLPLFGLTFARLLARPSPRRLLVVAGVLPLLSLHTLLPVGVAGAFLALVAVRLRRPAPAPALAYAGGVAALGLAVNAWWVLPLARHLSSAELPAWTFSATPRQLVADLASSFWPFAGLLHGTYGLRWWLVVGGVAGAAAAARRGGRDRAAAGRAALALALLALAAAYLSGLVPALARIEAHRFVLVAVLAALPFARRGLLGAWRGLQGGRRLRLVGLLACASLLLSLGCEGWLAWRTPLRPRPLAPHEREVLEFLRARRPFAGRVLAEHSPVGTLPYALALEPDLPGVTFRAAGQPSLDTGWDTVRASFLGLQREFSLEDAVQRLRLFAIEWAIAAEGGQGAEILRRLPEPLVAERQLVGGYLLVRLADPPSLLALGEGRLRVLPGRLELSGLTGEVALRLHYYPGLRALEGDDVRVFPIHDPHDRWGLIGVDPGGRSEVTLVWEP